MLLIGIVITDSVIRFQKRQDEKIRIMEEQKRELLNNVEKLKKDNGDLEDVKTDLKNENDVLQKQLKAKKKAGGLVASATYIKSDWRPLCEKYFGGQANNCLLAISRESGGVPTRVSATDDHGLMQINCSFVGSKGPGGWCAYFGVTREQLKEPELNIKLGKIVYDRSGWGAWTTMR